MLGVGEYSALTAATADAMFVATLIVFVVVQGIFQSTFTLPVYHAFALMSFLTAFNTTIE